MNNKTVIYAKQKFINHRVFFGHFSSKLQFQNKISDYLQLILTVPLPHPSGEVPGVVLSSWHCLYCRSALTHTRFKKKRAWSSRKKSFITDLLKKKRKNIIFLTADNLIGVSTKYTIKMKTLISLQTCPIINLRKFSNVEYTANTF